MTLLPFWIQRADLSSTNFEPVDVNGALSAISAHDWEEELHLLTKLEENALEYCPPGIGFVAPNGILHVCPGSDGRALVHYHCETTDKVLGFIPMTRNSVHTRESVERPEVDEMIHSFFQEDHDLLLSKFIG